MPVSAPLRVPVELVLEHGHPRWFRMSREVAEDGLLFDLGLPEECEGPLDVYFYIPDDDEPLAMLGRVIEVTPPKNYAGNNPNITRRAIRFIRPDEDSRARIARYVEARLTTPE